jgi:hypothetical protein
MAIVKSLQDGQADEKMYACRALDFLGSSINIYLSQGKKNFTLFMKFLARFLNFIILPFKFQKRKTFKTSILHFSSG